MNVEDVHSSGNSPASQIATHILWILSSTLSCFEQSAGTSSGSVALQLAVWRIARAISERSGGGSCSHYSCSVAFSSSWYESSQYPFHISAICASSVKLSQWLTGYIEDVARTSESLIWLSARAAWNFLLSSLLPVPRTCLPAAAVYLLWAFVVPQPSVLAIAILNCAVVQS